MLWRSFPHSASTRTPQPNKRQSVGAGRVGAIRRDHAARQCSAAHLGRVAALCTPCSLSGRLFTRCSSDLAVQLNKRTRRTKNACSNTRTALLVHGSAGMISAGSRRGSSHALVPWNREQAWSASGPSGGHAFSGRTDSNRLNTEQQIGHASVTRSRTLVVRASRPPKAVATYTGVQFGSLRYFLRRESCWAARGGANGARLRAHNFRLPGPADPTKGERAAGLRLGPHGRIRTLPGANHISKSRSARSGRWLRP